MEYPPFSNYTPMWSGKDSLMHCNGYNSPPRLNSSGSSMDTDIRDPMKIKDTQDEEFTWTNDIRISLDDERNGYYDPNPPVMGSVKHNMCRGNEQIDADDQELIRNQEDLHSKDIDGYNSKQTKCGRNQKDEKEAADQFGRLVKMAKKSSEGNNKGELHMFLERSQNNAGRNQLNCDDDDQESIVSGLSRKRKMDMTWQSNKVRPGVLQREMIGGRWPVDDIEIDLANDLSNSGYNMSDALLTLPVFKQESPSPTNGPRDQTSPNRTAPWHAARQQMMMNNNNVSIGGSTNCPSDQQHSPNFNQINNNNSCNVNQQQGTSINGDQQNNQMAIHSNNTMPNSQALPVISSVVSSVVSYGNGLQDSINTNTPTNQSVMDVANGLLLCSSHLPVENFNNCSMKANMPQIDSYQDNRFQYILAAATSMATKCNEDTLTYLNQCQPYEIKLKKLGDLSHYRGKVLKSVIRICFHERRLQFAEREQMALWQSERPGERIVEVDVPLSLGLLRVVQPMEHHLLNTVEVFWDPVKEAGVCIKVNCISTEFTAKKHGGEKGVPFRIQIETFLPVEEMPASPSHAVLTDKRLHAAACQIKVFKLKGADRKHKQDKEKILRRPPNERDKYQKSYDCTVFTDLPNDAVFSSSSVGAQSFSPEHCSGLGVPIRASVSSPVTPPRTEAAIHTIGMPTSLNDMKYHGLSRTNSHGSSLDCDDEAGRSLVQCTLGSPGEIPELNVDILTESSTPFETRAWLTNHRFIGSTQAFGNFSGSDLLRSSRDDLIQICGVADGIRLYNALHAERSPARLTLYIKRMSEQQYNAVYLRNCQVGELKKKIGQLLQDGGMGLTGDIYVAGPSGIRIRLTDEVVQNFKNDSTFRLEPVEGGMILILT